MNSKEQNMQTAPFVELLAVPQAQAKNPLFDIIIEDKVNIQNYCNALITKILGLCQYQFNDFIEYQFNQVKNPEIWLNKFEKLLVNNSEQFEGIRNNSKFIKLYTLIELKRKELQSSCVKDTNTKTPKRFINAESEDRHFSFYEVKKHVNSLNCYSEKVIYLTDEICNYREAEILFTNTKLSDFKKQCKTLLRRIEEDKELKTKLVREKEEEYNKSNTATKTGLKIQINGPINIITHAFKQMMVTINPNGKPYIPYKIKDVAQFICDNFVDEKGQPLSQATIQTYLSPNRTDKDPNSDTAVKL